MVLSHSVVRIYTPATCTLKITGKVSPLARWMGKTMLKNLRFELRFNDPRQVEEQPVKIWGEQEELESLYKLVTDYVQKFLQPASTNLPLLIKENGKSPVASNAQVIPLRRNMSSQDEDNSVSTVEPEKSFIAAIAAEPRLEPKGLLAHQLFLGYLASDGSVTSLKLNTTQLFDLATALDEY
ncbi:MAG: DUF4335 domain-containing protein, partial [Okeania sp. SIO2D1]|nr:DUF4335 domain-containing protein [Okeania sp. SIO2D1]